MPDLTIVVAGRSYRVSCAPGEEPRLRRMAARLAGRVEAVTLQAGRIDEDQALLIAALMLEDELDEAAAAPTGPGDAGWRARIEAALNDAATRLETLAAALDSAQL